VSTHTSRASPRACLSFITRLLTCDTPHLVGIRTAAAALPWPHRRRLRPSHHPQSVRGVITRSCLLATSGPTSPAVNSPCYQGHLCEEKLPRGHCCEPENSFRDLRVNRFL
jgi:hypothetical protein